MKNSSKQECFRYLCEQFPGLSEVKLKEGVFLGPDIKKFMKDEDFELKMEDQEKKVWRSFKQVITGFLENKKDPNYNNIAANLLNNYKLLGCTKSVKVHFLHSHLVHFLENLGAVSEEQEERFHQDVKEMERSSQGRWNVNMMADYCWMLKRQNLQSYSRKSTKRSFVENGNATTKTCCECLVYSGTFGKEFGRFKSPDWPRPYPDRLRCVLYTFIAGHHEIIKIEFLSFDLHNPNPGCSEGDYLVVYPSGTDGAVNEESAPLGRLCGSEAINLYSSGPSIVLEFHTEVNIRNSTGFNGKFTFIQADGYRTEGERVPGTSCDYLFSRATAGHNSSSGVFYSPGYPSSYPRKARCAYNFRARPKERVKIIFEELDFQKGDVSCLDREDVIKVHDGGSALSPVIAVLCNQMSRAEIISSSHQIFIEMATSSYWPGHGFTASYHFLTLESRPEDEENKAVEGPAVSATRYSCEVLIRSEYRRAGTVTSPGYPGPNLSGSRCRFAFIGSGKERIRIHVKHYNPSLYSCGIQLFNLMEGKRKPIPIPCLQAGPWLPIMSSGHRLEIDLDNETTIFRAEYIFLKNYGIKTGRQLSEYPCAFRYSADDFLSGSFHSPNFPGPYPIATECHYFFHGARGHRIRIHFSYFDMDGISPCNSKTRSDYIEFFNFPDRLSRRHCGQLEPFEVLLERRFFRVTFRSGTKRGMGTGFNASYQFLSYPKPAHHGLLPVSSSARSINGMICLISMIAFLLH